MTPSTSPGTPATAAAPEKAADKTLEYQSHPEPPVSSELRLSVALRQVLEKAEPPEGDNDANTPPLTLGLIISATGERAMAVLMAFICLPFIQPIPLPGLSIPFGIALLILGIQVAVRKHNPWLPKRLANLKLPQKFGRKLIGFVAKVFRPLERIIRPRFLLMQNPVAMVLVGIALIIDALMLVVLPAFPGSNLIPAWFAMIKILGMTEEDGVCLLGGTIVSIAAAASGVLALVFCWDQVWGHLSNLFTAVM